jgi:magnesium transporter
MSTNTQAEIRNRLWQDGNLVAEGFPFEQISEHLGTEGALVWVDICDPDPAHLRALAAELTLHPQAVEDALEHSERAKATRYATHTFLTAYATSATAGGEKSLEVHRVSAFVLPRGMITVRTSSDFDLGTVIARWDDNADLLKFGVSALVHGLLDVIVDSHFVTVQALDDQIEEVEDVLFDDGTLSRDIQRRTYRIRRDLVELRRVVLPMRELVNAVLRHHKDFGAPTELDPWFDDLYDHVLRAAEWTESLRDMVSAIFETNLSLQDARLNTVMKQLTAWAAIIAVPTAITGFFGQNVPYPGFGRPLGFVLSTSAIVLIAGALYLMFKRRSWL